MTDAESEANHFAMHLLVPTKFLRVDLAEIGGIDIAEDDTLRRLAKKYGVSLMLMSKRIVDVTEKL